jgi:hypothetical protein
MMKLAYNSMIDINFDQSNLEKIENLLQGSLSD